MHELWLKIPRPFRFLVTGGINTVFGYSCYAALLYVGFHYAWAALFGTVLAILFNYLTTSRLVFESSQQQTGQARRFVLSYVALYFVNLLLLWLLDLAGVNPYMAGLILILPMAAVSYFVLKKIVFTSRIDTSEDPSWQQNETGFSATKTHSQHSEKGS